MTPAASKKTYAFTWLALLGLALLTTLLGFIHRHGSVQHDSGADIRRNESLSDSGNFHERAVRRKGDTGGDRRRNCLVSDFYFTDTLRLHYALIWCPAMRLARIDVAHALLRPAIPHAGVPTASLELLRGKREQDHCTGVP